MHLGGCIKSTFGFEDCYNDVTGQMHRRCSGRQSCTLRIPDSIMDRTGPCNDDLTNYLEANYTCIKSEPPEFLLLFVYLFVMLLVVPTEVALKQVRSGIIGSFYLSRTCWHTWISLKRWMYDVRVFQCATSSIWPVIKLAPSINSN